VNENLLVIDFLNCFRLVSSSRISSSAFGVLEKAIKIPMYMVNEVAVNMREGRCGA